MFRRHHILLILAVALAGCEGARNNSSWSTAKPGDAIVPSLASTPKASESTPPAAPQTSATSTSSDKGVGPINHVDISKLDGARALTGSQVFATKCSACHKLDERYIGPALAGVTKRRQPEWILNMILNPENMIQQDAIAKGLLAEYIAPMANQHLTPEEAESILAYFLQHDSGAAESPTSAQTGGASQPVAQK